MYSPPTAKPPVPAAPASGAAGGILRLALIPALMLALLTALASLAPAANAARKSSPAAVTSQGSPLQQQANLDQPGQPLDRALLQLGQSYGVSLVFSTELTHGLQAPALRGDMLLATALATLLADTGLEARLSPQDTIILVPLAANLAAEIPANGPSAAPMSALAGGDSGPPGIEELLVTGRALTGSRIRHAGYNLNTRVDVIERQELEQSGAQSLAELLQFLPAVAGNSTSTQVTNGGDGSASLTLRGLPASNTLILINGRRTNSDALQGRSVDLNTIPLAAVDRIEILKEGASPIYGSDAIAGVVNVITRRHAPGLHLSTYYGSSTRDDLGTSHTNLLWGTESDRSSLLLGGSYYRQQGVYSKDRSISRTADDRARGGIDGRSSATATARVTLPDGPVILAREDDNGRDAQDYRPATVEDRFDHRSFSTAIVPSERWSLFAENEWRWSEQVETFAEVLFTSTKASNTLAPTPIFTGFESVDLTVATDNQYNPFGMPVADLRRRLVELPDRRQDNRTDTLRLTAGFTLREGPWQVDGFIAQNSTDARESLDNILRASRLQQGLGPAAGCLAPCVPIDLFGPAGSVTPDMLAWITTGTHTRGESRMRNAAVNLSRPLWSLPAGQMQVAGGVEYRDEWLQVSPDALLVAGDTIGGANYGPTSGDRHIWEIYAETLVPLLRDRALAHSLDLELAGRLSSYSDFGSSQTPRVSLTWQPVHTLQVKGAWALGFRAPSLLELNTAPRQSFAFLNDPCSNPNRVPDLAGCSQASDPTLVQFSTFTSGNPDLLPERARTYTLGVEWKPLTLPGLRLAMDWYSIDQRNVVDSSAQFVVNENARSGAFASLVLRDGQGNLQEVRAPELNIGQRKVTGLDFEASAALPPSRWGLFEVALNASHISQFVTQLSPDTAPVDAAGTFSDEASEGSGALPEWKANLGMNWALGDFEASYNVHYVSTLDEVVPLVDESRGIASWRTHHMQLSWTGDHTLGARITLGVNNLFDEAPPFAAAAFNDSFDSRTYDLTGRYLYLRLDTRR